MERSSVKRTASEADEPTESTSKPSDPSTTQQEDSDSDSAGSTSAAPQQGAAAEKDKHQERLKKLQELHMKRNAARKQNHSEVVEEDKRSKLPANWEAKKRRVEGELEYEQAKKEAEAQGKDFSRIEMLSMTVEESERLAAKSRPADPDSGRWSDFATASVKQYNRNVRQLKPNLDEYHERMKEQEKVLPALAHYPGQNAEVSRDGVERMVADLQKTIDKKSNFSRRRAFDGETNVNYINEKNMRYNQAVERAFGKYTQGIKDDLERGTAL